ncbi:hypothetical protein PsYK624_046900 [Phanerochaete sordida]|uniref:Transmembrane protein n=1 Tax=Phanerochaete sordida TaxID=48140 RepID=A0A9P3G5S4_9APHY|nr:hypothetical protein PsYK624_046900 [Phanerochaete sordida]
MLGPRGFCDVTWLLTLYCFLGLAFGLLGEAKPLPAVTIGFSYTGSADSIAQAEAKIEPATRTQDTTAKGVLASHAPRATESDPWTFSYSTPDWLPSITVPTYSIPTTFPTAPAWDPFDTSAYSYPTYSYSIPSFSYPTYSYSIPSFSVPTYSYPTVGAGGGGDGGKTDPLAPAMSELGRGAKTSLKKIIGAVVGSVLGFFSFLGGLWAACRRRMRRKKRGAEDDPEKVARHGRAHSAGTVGGVPTLGYQQGYYMPYDQVPLMAGGYPVQVRVAYETF